MLHHISLGISNLNRSRAFYDAVLAPLGYVRVFEHDTAVGYGKEGGGDKLSLKWVPEVTLPGDGFHLAFAASTPDQVSAFHAAALQHGGAATARRDFAPTMVPITSRPSSLIPMVTVSKP
ncbi:VOC family protein [Chromobacterium vaccinii]|uniref:VOC family protein n=1 Tax=Chromobacterium vaccinii TaxID=1108595 RepID=UPI001910321F|nr:VOC family protein [Chromobacterium vaccinii]